ncbi:hypothetical protein [Wolinella succinogenes]|uniref:hypothetical protein n=1 Tax=Wolinella succinogenes TaxID=844 RepID=UPI000312F98D|nr:hypothetical protein [Wolinella succinogenes]VEG80949.1 Uncharacterised protein [Wolinella succinogenes]HCZ18555.1 hypothetical protein [Helicobacter sp.]
MGYSFIAPQPKRILLKITRIWLFYVILTFGILLFFVGFLQMQRDYMLKSALESEKSKQELLVQIAALKSEMERVRFEKSFADDLRTQNGMLSESVKNLFELIPDQITLQAIEMERDRLTIKGITPSKEIYSFLLEVPLRSIFHESRADFYALPNGWFSFVSVSRLKEEP